MKDLRTKWNVNALFEKIYCIASPPPKTSWDYKQLAKLSKGVSVSVATWLDCAETATASASILFCRIVF